MATKKITDLTLRSDFDGTCNLPADDTSQTWRVTGAQILDFIEAALAIADSTVWLDTNNGYGGTKTTALRFTNNTIATGSDLSYNDSSANGGEITVNTDGRYSINFEVGYNGFGSIGAGIAIAVGSVSAGTPYYTVPIANTLARTGTAVNATSGGFALHCSWTGYLNAGDVISFINSGTAINESIGATQVRMSRIA